MSTVPVPRVWVSSEILTAANMNTYVSGIFTFLLNRPICQARQTVAQSIANNSTVALTFDSEDFDSTGMHSTVTNTSRLTAVYPGTYDCDGGYGAAANATGVRVASFQVNGTLINGSGTDTVSLSAAGSNRLGCRGILIFLNVGDFLELGVLQNSGGALNTAVNTVEQSTLTAVWTSN